MNAQNTTAALSEQELLNDLLNDAKHLISVYGTAITESSCPNMRQMLLNNFSDVSQDQYQIFDWMSRKGYYQVKDAQDADVQQAQQKFNQMKTQL